MSDSKVYSVHEYLDLVNETIAKISVVVEGEISSLKKHQSGHVYFDLCEIKNGEKAMFSCAIWKYKAQYLSWDLKEGEKVQITGKANIYKTAGRYSFIIDQISPVGEGALKQAYEKLKKQLSEKGFFSPEHKKPLPKYPQNIAVITSRSGAAINDFSTHLGWFGMRVNIVDTRVEGMSAIGDIARKIEFVNKNYPEVDLIVITRGGGSLESLQAFNSLEVAQAIFSSRIPILSAVGHEDDVTIADLVADRRASTPTDAGNIVSEGWREARNKIQLVSQSFANKVDNMILKLNRKLIDAQSNFFLKFSEAIYAKSESLAFDEQNMFKTFKGVFAAKSERLRLFEKQLLASDPDLKLKQGYSIIRNSNNKIVKNVDSVGQGDQLLVQVSDGIIKTSVRETERQ